MSASVDGSLWMSGRGKDLSRRSRGGFFQAYNIPGNRAVQALLASKEGSLWMAYGMGGEGVTRLTTEGLTEHYTVLDGLGHNEVHALMEDGEGHIWAGTSAGVARFDGQNWTALKGMSEMEVHALFMARDGAIWMRTADGSAVRYWNDRKGPRTYLTNPQVQVPASGNVNVDWEGRDRWLAGADALEFSWRLDGSAWGPYTEQIRTSLFSLPDGTHTFEIRARDADQADFGTRQAAGNGQ
ncbi:MAG: hypothetical protein O7G87_06020 [bacterium]|nr:hypothetical protein [bacterium]